MAEIFVKPDENFKEVLEKIAKAITSSPLPEIVSADAGKVLTVNSEGEWEVRIITPEVTAADAGKVLTVNSEGEWVAAMPE